MARTQAVVEATHTDLAAAFRMVLAVAFRKALEADHTRALGVARSLEEALQRTAVGDPRLYQVEDTLQEQVHDGGAVLHHALVVHAYPEERVPLQAPWEVH